MLLHEKFGLLKRCLGESRSKTNWINSNRVEIRTLQSQVDEIEGNVKQLRQLGITVFKSISYR